MIGSATVAAAVVTAVVAAVPFLEGEEPGAAGGGALRVVPIGDLSVVRGVHQAVALNRRALAFSRATCSSLAVS